MKQTITTIKIDDSVEIKGLKKGGHKVPAEKASNVVHKVCFESLLIVLINNLL